MGFKVVVINNHSKSVLGFRWSIICALKKLGCEVLVYAPRDDNVAEQLIKEKIEYKAIPLRRTGLNPIFDMYLFFNLYCNLKKDRADKVLCYTAKPVIYGSIAAYFAGVKQCFSVITGLGYVFIGNDFKKKIIRRIITFLYRFALGFNSKIFFQNEDDLRLFVTHKMVDENRVVRVNGSGVDLAYFKEAPLPSKCSFLLLTRLLREKGVVEYFMAVEKLKQKYPDVSCKLAGDLDPNPAALSQEELDYWLKRSKVEYLGYLADVRSALAGSCVYVLPSYREGTSRSVLEAMAMGRPIITTDAPGCRNTVVDGVNGYLIPVKSVDKLYSAMEQFVLYPEIAVKMGKESRRIAEDMYDVVKVNKMILTAMRIT